MKKLNTNTTSLYFLFFVLLATAGLTKISYADPKPHVSPNYSLYFPEDSTEEDTTLSEEGFFDTTSYHEGLDSIFFYSDSLLESDTLSTGMREMILNPYMTITPGSNPKNLVSGVFGVHMENNLDRRTLYNDGTQEYAWQWFNDLAPTVVRFPGGAFSKFMHLLFDPYTGESAKGYGYNMFEKARYFDWTDGIMHLDHTTLDADLYEPVILDVDAELELWMDSARVEHYNKYREKYFIQTCETRRYIDDFIEKINALDSAYPGRPKTKVILDLNILSETATECRDITDYLRQHGVNVVAVEMGNEMYEDFCCQAAGFHTFDDYIRLYKWRQFTG